MGKYDKFTVSGPAPGQPGGTGLIGSLNGEMFEGCHEYDCRWVYKNPGNVPGGAEGPQVIHGPHIHKYPEVIFHLGTDPNNPMELGAEVEMHMGPELEKHMIIIDYRTLDPFELDHCMFICKKK